MKSGRPWIAEKSWAPKNWCFWAVVLEKTPGSPLDCKEVKPVHPKGDQSWMFIGRTDVEAEAPILWPPYVKSWLIWKDPDSGKDWGQEEKGTTEDEMLGWPVGDGQGGLACCDPWGHKELDMTERLNWTELSLVWQSRLSRGSLCFQEMFPLIRFEPGRGLHLMMYRTEWPIRREDSPVEDSPIPLQLGLLFYGTSGH